MIFVAEIKKVSQRKSVSLDKVNQLVLETDDDEILNLGKIPSDVTVKVTVDINE